jgi:gas vesicle protein
MMTEQNKQDNQEGQENVEVLDKVYTKKDVITGGMIGWALGVATTVFFAPKSGKELRGDITYQVGNAKDKAVDKSKELSDSTMEKYTSIKSNATDKAKELTTKITNLKKTNDKAENNEDTEEGSQLQSNDMEDAMGSNEEEKAEQSSGNESATKSKTTTNRQPRNRRTTGTSRSTAKAKASVFK